MRNSTGREATKMARHFDNKDNDNKRAHLSRCVQPSFVHGYARCGQVRMRSSILARRGAESGLKLDACASIYERRTCRRKIAAHVPLKTFLHSL